MDIQSPPPPSPSCSEPPPSYDSLSLGRHHPPPGPSNSGSIILHHHPLHSVTTTTSNTIAALQQHQPSEPPTGAIEEEIDGPPPPPYSPGLGDALGTAQHEGTEFNLPPGAELNLSPDADGPPSYHSLFGQIQEARQRTNSNIIFLRKLCHIIMSTLGCTLLLILLTFVPLAVLVLGVVYLDDCPLEPYIPVFLIIGGLAGLIKVMLLITESVVRKKSASIMPRVRHLKLVLWMWRTGNLLFNLLMVVWVIAGSYWVYGTYMEMISDGFTSCNVFLYKFAFAFVTCSYIFLLMMFSCMFFLAGASLRKAALREGEGETTPPPSPPPPETTPTHSTPPPTPPPETTPLMQPNPNDVINLNLQMPSNLPSFPEEAEEEEAALADEGGNETRRFGTGNEVGTRNGNMESERMVAREGSTLATLSVGEGLANGNDIITAPAHSSMGNLSRGPSHFPQAPPTSTTAPSHQRTYSHSSSRGYHSHQHLLPVDVEIQSPTTPLYENFPNPSHQPHPFRRMASFGSNEVGMHLRQPASSFSVMRGAVSFSPMVSQSGEGSATQKGMNRPRSIPYLHESQHAYEMDQRYCCQGNRNLAESGCESTESSLYNTSQLDGFSITAV